MNRKVKVFLVASVLLNLGLGISAFNKEKSEKVSSLNISKKESTQVEKKEIEVKKSAIEVPVLDKKQEQQLVTIYQERFPNNKIYQLSFNGKSFILAGFNEEKIQKIAVNPNFEIISAMEQKNEGDLKEINFLKTVSLTETFRYLSVSNIIKWSLENGMYTLTVIDGFQERTIQVNSETGEKV